MRQSRICCADAAELPMMQPLVATLCLYMREAREPAEDAVTVALFTSATLRCAAAFAGAMRYERTAFAFHFDSADKHMLLSGRRRCLHDVNV
jgi:hypothetical protein